jgi:hypothetical protein
MMMSSARQKTEDRRQQDNEPLAKYYKRFTSCVDVEESRWGTPVPAAVATIEMNEKMSRDKFRTCVFYRSGYQKVWKVETTRRKR